MARLAALLLAFAVAASAVALAHGRGLQTPIKLTSGAAGVVGGDSNECVYTVYVRTGSIWKAGTDANITLELTTADNSGLQIKNLPAWGGLMYKGHSYFERSNLDIFSGRGPCLASAPCRMKVSSDGSGEHHGWYCNYVEVTVTGPHKGCKQQRFDVEQWLATDVSPYKLDAVVNHCSSKVGAASA